MDDRARRWLDRPIGVLELTVRASNCLEAARIETIRDLVLCTEHELLRLRSFGRTSLFEVKTKLADLGLRVGMTPEERSDDAGH
jgi:DNA-directed RNA polymerase subunit alpha